MASARTATKTTAKAVTMTRAAAEDVAAEDAQEPVVSCAFPLEVRDGKCPVAVFNAPDAPNTSIVRARDRKGKPIKFLNGLFVAFRESEADTVRHANKGNSYLEGSPRLGDEPLVCNACFPKTRWYSAAAYERHIRRFHSA